MATDQKDGACRRGQGRVLPGVPRDPLCRCQGSSCVDGRRDFVDPRRSGRTGAPPPFRSAPAGSCRIPDPSPRERTQAAAGQLLLKRLRPSRSTPPQRRRAVGEVGHLSPGFASECCDLGVACHDSADRPLTIDRVVRPVDPLRIRPPIGHGPGERYVGRVAGVDDDRWYLGAVAGPPIDLVEEEIDSDSQLCRSP